MLAVEHVGDRNTKEKRAPTPFRVGEKNWFFMKQDGTVEMMHRAFLEVDRP